MAHNRPQMLIEPDVRCGSISTELGCKRHVRFPSNSNRIADIVGGRFRAKPGSRPAHSITWSASN
jgi:hypothetical protein